MRRFALPALLLALAGCGGDGATTDVGAGPGPMAGGPGPGAGSPLKEIMRKLARGPQSLTPVLGRELKEEPTPWDKVQPQAKEYAKLAGSMAEYEPPKGEKDSWVKQTADYAKAAVDLDKAAQAKDLTAANEAHGKLTKSCDGCHREHRMMGPGRGGPPGGPGGFPGGPPGGPGGPPGGGPGGPPDK